MLNLKSFAVLWTVLCCSPLNNGPPSFLITTDRAPHNAIACNRTGRLWAAMQASRHCIACGRSSQRHHSIRLDQTRVCEKVQSRALEYSSLSTPPSTARHCAILTCVTEMTSFAAMQAKQSLCVVGVAVITNLRLDEKDLPAAARPCSRAEVRLRQDTLR